MSSKIMLQLAAAIQDSKVDFDRNANLPRPNIYFASIYPNDGHTFSGYFAADFTGAAMTKVSHWCVSHHGFRPYRSNSTIKLRRMQLGDLIENPNAYCAALANAKENCESDVVRALRQLPGVISAMVGVPLPVLDAKAADDLWDRLSEEVCAMGLRA